MLFLSDLSRPECTKYTSQQGFDVADSPTGHGEEKRVFADNKHRWRQVTRCVGHEIALQTEYAESNNESSHCFQSARFRPASRVRGVSHFTECADNQETRLVVGTNKELAVLRVRGDGQHNTMREVTLETDTHIARLTYAG